MKKPSQAAKTNSKTAAASQSQKPYRSIHIFGETLDFSKAGWQALQAGADMDGSTIEQFITTAVENKIASVNAQTELKSHPPAFHHGLAPGEPYRSICIFDGAHERGQADPIDFSEGEWCCIEEGAEKRKCTVGKFITTALERELLAAGVNLSGPWADIATNVQVKEFIARAREAADGTHLTSEVLMSCIRAAFPEQTFGNAQLASLIQEAGQETGGAQ